LAIVNCGHINDKDIVELAVLTEAKEIVYSHLYRELDGDRLNALAKKEGYNGRLIAGEDLVSFSI